MTELEQEAAVEKYFNNILPIALPKNKNRRCWKLINTKTALDTFKPLATILLNANDKYIIKVIEAFGIAEKIAEAEKEYAGQNDYDITIAIKKGTNIISFTKSVEPAKGSSHSKEWYVMYCIPINDQEIMAKIMKTINSQKTKTPLLIIKNDLDR